MRSGVMIEFALPGDELLFGGTYQPAPQGLFRIEALLFFIPFSAFIGCSLLACPLF